MIDSSVIFGAFVLFCRIGGCLMIAPGVSSSQIPVQIRVLIAIAATLALSPILLDDPSLRKLEEDPIGMARTVVVEALIGLLIGFLARVFFSALETLSTGAANLLGLTNPFGVEVDTNLSMPPLATLATLGATALIFVSDFHWEILRGLLRSYQMIPVGVGFDGRYSLVQIGDTVARSFLIAVQVASPFFLYSIIANFSLTLINRVTPQIAIFFVAPPFVVSGGLVLLYFTVKAQLGEFMASFSAWLIQG
jgi:flagellar biosynthetic protein FliR